MNTLLKKIIRLYDFFLATSLLVYGLVGIKNAGGYITIGVFLIIEAYFIFSYFKKNKLLLSLLLTLSVISSWIILLSIILSIKNPANVITVIFFIPLVIDLTTELTQKWKTKKITPRETRVEEGMIVDGDFQIERRKILKMFAGTTAGALLLYLINPKKANAAFFGSIPGPGTVAIKDSLGAVVDPSIKNPTDSYGIADVDESTSTHYYGFIHYNNTDWYIFKESSSGACTYASKVNNALVTYSDGWTARTTTLIFGTYAEAF